MVDVARGSRVAVTYGMESVWGELDTAATLYELRVTGIGVTLSKDSFQSQELRSDRQIADLRHGMFSVAGDIPVELSHTSFDDIIESAMFEDWTSSNTIVTGTTMKSFTLQKHFSDINEYHVFPGCVVNSWSLNVTPNGLITSVFNVMGETMETTAAAWSGSASAKSANSPFDAFTGTLSEGGVVNALVTGIDMTLSNQLTALQVVGNNKAIGLTDGRANITGTMTAYFANSTLLGKFINETESSLEFTLGDGVNTMTFEMPRIKYSGGDVPVNDEGPIILNMPFQALYSAGDGYSLQITRS
jgi:hypothetical protein